MLLACQHHKHIWSPGKTAQAPTPSITHSQESTSTPTMQTRVTFHVTHTHAPTQVCPWLFFSDKAKLIQL